MRKIEEIKEGYNKTLSLEARENLLFKEILKYYKKKRFLFPIMLLLISITVFSFLEDIFSIFGKEYLKASQELSFKIILTTALSLIFTFSIPIIHVLFKKDQGKFETLIEQEKRSLIKKEIGLIEKEIDDLNMERINFEEYIIEKEAEKKVLQSML